MGPFTYIHTYIPNYRRVKFYKITKEIILTCSHQIDSCNSYQSHVYCLQFLYKFLTFWFCSNQIEKEQIRKHASKSSVSKPSYFIAVDNARKCVVLSVRGTYAATDVLTDLQPHSEAFEGGQVSVIIQNVPRKSYRFDLINITGWYE